MPTESARTACSAGSSSTRVTIGSGMCTSSESSRRVARERSMSRHTRDTTVVSHARRSLTSPVSARDRRSQASCTASSASVSEPSMR